MKKPKGQIGPIKYSASADSVKFDEIPLPDTKEEIEKYIVDLFIRTGRSQFRENFFVDRPIQNLAGDFDFDVVTPKGKAYLELMEIAPLELYKTTHDKAPESYKPYEIAKFAFEKIQAKEKKYPKNLAREIFLLLYITNWKFALSDLTVNILGYFCHNSINVFDVIFLLTPRDAKEGYVHWISPVPNDFFNGFDLEAYKDKVVLNLNPTKWIGVTLISD